MNVSMYIEKVVKESPRDCRDKQMNGTRVDIVTNKENTQKGQPCRAGKQKEESHAKKRDMNEALKILNEKITLTLKQSNDRTKNLRQILKKIQQN